MFRKAIYSSFLLFSFNFADNDYWQQSVNYKMDVILIDSVRQLACSSTITYKNNSPDKLSNIYMHLYPNAFQLGSVKSRDYINGYGSRSRASYFEEGLDGHQSKINIRNLVIAKNENIILDNYKINDTVLRAMLKKPILPGEEVIINIDWNHHIGDMVERAGYYEGQYNMAQWYPKIAVYDDKGWHADPFHAEGEFYGEFGDFEVEFDLPRKFIIGASGIVSNGDPGWEMVRVDTSADFHDWFEEFENLYIEPGSKEKRNVKFVAKNVHDFAWVASPNFLYEHDKYKDIDVHVLYNRVNAYDWNRVVRERSVRALHWLSDKFGEYTYPQVTNTDRLKSGGMEYPMLIMDGSDSESLIVHEIGHIWFYGILGNNEVDEAWIDEGFTTAQTRDYMIDRYGPIGFDWNSDEWTDGYQRKFWSFNKKLHNDQWSSIRYMLSGYDEPISRKSFLFKNSYSYRQNAYTKPSLMLNELKYLLGDSLYYESIQDFYNNWKLKHVDEKKFIKSVEKVAEKDFDWFFDPWLHDTRIMDYSINKWGKKKNKDETYEVWLEIRNLGNRHMPMLVETEFSDGSIDRRWWKNYEWKNIDKFVFNVPRDPVKVTLDPDVQTMDVDYRNNSTKLSSKILFDWPGMNYKPRNQIIYSWLPSLQYNNTDKYIPGIKVRRSYGNYENQSFQINYSTSVDSIKNKNLLYWSYSGSFKPVHRFKNLKLNFKAFDLPGLAQVGAELEKMIYSEGNYWRPKQKYKFGFYAQSKVDTQRTNLFEDGKLSALYLKHSIDYKFFQYRTEILSSILPYSKWDFSKIAITSTYKQTKAFSTENIVRLLTGTTHGGQRARLFLGKIWTDELGVPQQISLKAAGNQSSLKYEKSYLRDSDSFFGYENFNDSYHLTSDGNIRGFTNYDNIESDALLSVTSEIYFLNKKVDARGFFEDRYIDFEFAFFSDSGVIYNRGNARSLSDFGIGVRLSSRVFNKPLHLRIDFPILMIDDGKKINDNKFIFSFERSI